MEKKEQAIGRSRLQFNEREVQLVLTMLEKLERTIDLLYYLMERENGCPFVMVLVSAESFDIESLLKRQKRDVDLLYEIDRSENLYVVICRETKIDGGYRFAQRLMKDMSLDAAEHIYCISLDVRTSKYGIKEVILQLMEAYIEAKLQQREAEIIFRSLY